MGASVHAEGAPRVRGWVLELLRSEYGPEDVPVPAEGESFAPMAILLEALDRIAADEAPSRRPDREAGRAVAARWSAAHPLLLEELRRRPDRLLRLVAEDFLGQAFDPAPVAVRRLDATRATLAVDPQMPAPFLAGVLEGLLAPATARCDVRVHEGSLDVAWTPVARAPGEAAPRLLGIVRWPFLAATLVPVLVAFAVAARDGPIDPLAATLTFLGVVLFQWGANALNDYYDPQPGTTAPRGLRTAAYVLYGLGTLVGLTLVVLHGIEVLWLGFAGVTLGLLYSAPPVRLAHRGLGELAAAVGFGPLIVMGAYFVQREAWSPAALLASFPLAFVIAAVLYVNEFHDREGDARVGKRTLIVRLPERAAVVLYVALQALTYLVILGGVALRGVPSLAAYAFPAWSLLGLLTAPLAARATLALARDYRYPHRLVAANRALVGLHLATSALFGVGFLLPRFA